MSSNAARNLRNTPVLWTLSGRGKIIIDYLLQVIDASAALHIRPLEFQLIILRHTEGSRGGRGCHRLTSSAAQSVQAWLVMALWRTTEIHSLLSCLYILRKSTNNCKYELLINANYMCPRLLIAFFIFSLRQITHKYDKEVTDTWLDNGFFLQYGVY